MAFVPAYSTSQILGSPENIVFTDNSTGSDADIVSRRVYAQDSTGSFLVQEGTTTEYEVWAIGDASITLDLLTKDKGLRTVVQWLDAGANVLYSATKLEGFTLYNETFDYATTQALSGNPMLINDNNYFKNKSDLREAIDSGNQAISFAGDIFAAQQCYNRATELRLNSQYNFNINS